MTDHTVKMETVVTTDRVADLLCCALEGGSTYWCEAFKPDHYPEGTEYGHEAVAHGAPFRVKPDGEKWIQVHNSAEVLEETLQLMANTQPNAWRDFVQENEDAITGDVFFQLLVFGEVIYG